MTGRQDAELWDVQVPEARRQALAPVLAALRAADRLILTTHVNADGDGAGSEAALAAWLAERGKTVHVVNPTPLPELFRYLFHEDWLVEPGDPRLPALAAAAELCVVLDTGEPKRIGRVAKVVAGRPLVVIDHHPPGPERFEAVTIADPSAAATGELVFDLLQLAGDAAWPPGVAEALYVALVADTGSFRYANTTARTHAVAGALLARGVDPEAVYRRLYATVPLRRIELLRRALGRLEAEPGTGLSWITVLKEDVAETGADADDMDGLVEHARSIQGTELAILFREMDDGGTKVSFRSNGRADVNALAREFGGGGHTKAAGALVGGGLEAVRERVLAAARQWRRP
jgi:bifunctional oligoribonuclease and PAP phosphatase NrnA